MLNKVVKQFIVLIGKAELGYQLGKVGTVPGLQKAPKASGLLCQLVCAN